MAICVVTGCGNTTTSASARLALSASRGTEAYLCTFGYDDQPGHTVTTLDLARRLLGPPIPTGSLPSALAATPNGRLLLVTDQGNDTLALVDPTTDHVLTWIATGVEPDAVAVNPASTEALVANVDDDTVTPIDLPTMTAGPAIPVGPEPDALAFSPDGTTALVADFGSDTVTPITVSSLTAGAPVAVGPGPTALAVTVHGPAGGPTAWVGTGTRLVPLAFGPFPGSVSVSAGAGAAPVTVGHLVEALALTPAGTSAWVAGQDGTVTPVDLTTSVAGPSIYVGGRPEAVVIPPPRR